MTHDQQRKYKELSRYLERKAKEEFKKYRLKKRDYKFYVSKNDMFYSAILSMNGNKLQAYFYAKPLWLDDILWDILGMSSNKDEPISLRGVGAFTILSQIREEDYIVDNTEEIDEAVTKTFEELAALADSYEEDDFLADYQTIAYQQEAIKAIVLVHQEEYDKALALCRENKIGCFGVEGRSFAELAAEYIGQLIGE